MSIKGWINKENMASTKKFYSAIERRKSCHLQHLNKAETGGQSAKWNKPVTKGSILSDSVSQSVQSLSHLWLFVTPMNCSTPGLPVHYQLPELAKTHIHQVSDAIQTSQPLSSPSPPAFIRVFSNQAVLCIRWPKYWSYSSGISPSNKYSGLISFRIDWFDLLTVQGLSRVLSNTILQKHQFFRSQLSLWYNSHIHIWLLEKP